METRFLTTFRAIASLESFTLAARQLGYSQSTVSAQIRSLEAETGAQLFDRTGRKLRLTDTGTRLLELSENILSLETKVRGLSSEGSGPSGELRIAAVESLIVVRLRNILATFREACPNVCVSLHNSVCVETVDSVVHGEVELAFVIMPPLRHPDLDVLPLATEEMVFVASANADDDLLLRALACGRLEDCFIFTEQGCTYRIVVEHFFRERGVIPGRRMEMWSMDAIRRYVESGFGISFMPRMYVEEAIRRGALKILKAPRIEETFCTQLLRKKRCDLSFAACELVRIAQKSAGGWDLLETQPKPENILQAR